MGSITALVNYWHSQSGVHTDPAPHESGLGITDGTAMGMTLQQSGVVPVPSGLQTFEEEPAPTGIQDNET